MEAPVLIAAMPDQVANESTVFGPLDLKDFIQAPDGSAVHFRAELSNGDALPVGFICTDDGLLSGFPDDGTAGNYEVIITAANEGGSIQIPLSLMIGPNPEMVEETPAQGATPVEAVTQGPIPSVTETIPNQVINEGAAYGPFSLKEYFAPNDGLSFHAGLKDGGGLPKGMICTADGLLTGIPAKGTQGNYEVVVTAVNAAGSVDAGFIVTIKPSLTAKEADYIDKLKSQVWSALEQRLPVPDLGAMYDQSSVSLQEFCYLLERWGFIKIWDAFNLEPPGELVPITLEGVSEHYQVYDRGSCLVGCPKDLFSHERTIEDGMRTARAMAQEVYKRGWTVELVGIDKLTRAAWVEIQHLGDKYGRQLEVINFSPTSDDVKLYSAQALEMQRKSSGME